MYASYLNRFSMEFLNFPTSFIRNIHIDFFIALFPLRGTSDRLISCNQKRLKDKCKVVKELIEFKNSYLDRNLYREPHHIFKFFKFVKNRGEFREKTIKI